MPETCETTLELNLSALEHNYNFLRSRIRPTTKFMGVVKAFAYGSDANVIADRLEKLGVDYLAVAYVSEGVSLRNAGIKVPILVLHPQACNFDALIEAHLEPSLYSPKILNTFLEVASKRRLKKYPIHIKFNTGLNRLGFWENDVDFICDQVGGNPCIAIASLFSHLAASEDPSEQHFTQHQLRTFQKIAAAMETALGYTPLKHILNTSGIINYPDFQWDMVRSGIGLYGFGNEPGIDKQLRPVTTLKTVISQIHKIEPHETVGYNRAFISDAYRVTATLPIGHADGIGRHFGNGRASVNVHGQKAPIIGNVCMDMVMIDITEIDCREGDEVIIFGNDPNAETFASSANTISYELITGISQRVKRVIKGD